MRGSSVFIEFMFNFKWTAFSLIVTRSIIIASVFSKFQKITHGESNYGILSKVLKKRRSLLLGVPKNVNRKKMGLTSQRCHFNSRYGCFGTFVTVLAPASVYSLLVGIIGQYTKDNRSI